VGTLLQNWDRWYVSLEQHPGITVARFGHVSKAAGHQIWDEFPWPLTIAEMTERAILSELYDATLSFWDARE
jgi:hypothetical protein